MLVNGKARCIQQSEGVTIGDALGTFACCSTLAPAYAMVDQHLRDLMEDISPGAGEAVFNLACTDDLLSIIPVPEGATEAVMARVICKSLDLLNTEGRESEALSPELSNHGLRAAGGGFEINHRAGGWTADRTTDLDAREGQSRGHGGFVR